MRKMDFLTCTVIFEREKLSMICLELGNVIPAAYFFASFKDTLFLFMTESSDKILDLEKLTAIRTDGKKPKLSDYTFDTVHCFP